MKAPRALTLSLLLLSCAASGQGRDREAAEPGGQPARWARSGQFSTREQHVCSWQLVPAEAATELRLSCRAPAGGGNSEGLQCAYRGQPERCAAYSAKGRQYWKQILGKLRRKHHPCQDGSPLRARLCSAKGPPEAQLRLVPPSPAAVGGPGGGRANGGGRGQEAATLQQQQQPRAAGAKAVSSSADAGALEKRRKEGKRRGGPGSPAPPEKRPSTAAGSPEPPTELAGDLAETYCAEQWHSLCSFFVNFWNG
uniref:Fibroblast growth factor binding protein 3 n=1 Tax=Pelusios castaneus TaxID=367368 RepID=A0A8C8VM72_9SAUR